MRGDGFDWTPVVLALPFLAWVALELIAAHPWCPTKCCDVGGSSPPATSTVGICRGMQGERGLGPAVMKVQREE